MVLPDDTIECLGEDFDTAPAFNPSGSYAQVAAGIQYACALTTTGEVECAGVALLGSLDVPPAAACPEAGGADADGDAIVDICDVCPHSPDRAQLDSDRDNVGDACDRIDMSFAAKTTPFSSVGKSALGDFDGDGDDDYVLSSQFGDGLAIEENTTSPPAAAACCCCTATTVQVASRAT